MNPTAKPRIRKLSLGFYFIDGRRENYAGMGIFVRLVFSIHLPPNVRAGRLPAPRGTDSEVDLGAEKPNHHSDVIRFMEYPTDKDVFDLIADYKRDFGPLPPSKMPVGSWSFMANFVRCLKSMFPLRIEESITFFATGKAKNDALGTVPFLSA